VYNFKRYIQHDPLNRTAETKAANYSMHDLTFKVVSRQKNMSSQTTSLHSSSTCSNVDKQRRINVADSATRTHSRVSRSTPRQRRVSAETNSHHRNSSHKRLTSPRMSATSRYRQSARRRSVADRQPSGQEIFWLTACASRRR
jgi:hypothetical protein